LSVLHSGDLETVCVTKHVNRARFRRNSYCFVSQCTGIPRLTEILTREFKEVSKLAQEHTLNVHRIRLCGSESTTRRRWRMNTVGRYNRRRGDQVPACRNLDSSWIALRIRTWLRICTLNSDLRLIFRNANTAEVIGCLYCEMIE